jgi:replication fork protection complex subunit Tof1/Swi1
MANRHGRGIKRTRRRIRQRGRLYPTALLSSNIQSRPPAPRVISSLFALLLPPLSKPLKERTPRDGQIINLILHLIRNLAFIRDLPRDVRSSADQAELGSLQGKLIRQLEETHFLELLLVLAANKDADPMFNSWNTLVLEIFYLLVRGVRPGGLCVDLTKVCIVTM